MDNLGAQTLFYIFESTVVALLIIASLAGIFSVYMLKDCLERNFPTKNKWLALITILNIIGALFYFFIIKQRSVINKSKPNKITNKSQIKISKKLNN